MRTTFLAACSLLLSLSALACGGEEFVATPTPEQGGSGGGGGEAGTGGSDAGSGGSDAGAGGSDAGAGGSEAGAGGDAGQGGATAGSSDGGTAGDAGQGGEPGAGAGGTAGSGGAGAGGNGGGAAGDAGAGGSDAGSGGSDAGSGGGAGCEEPKLLCAGVCVEESVKHCGGCEPCPTPKDDHATASCNGGLCGASCAPGFAPTAGRCRDLGGWFVTHQIGETTHCTSGNEMSSAKCTCPEGFSKASLGAIPQPGVAATDGNAPLLTACVPGAIAGDLTKPAGNWGGAYLREVGTGQCRWGNPYRSDNQCGCPGEGWIEEKIPLKESPNAKELEFYTCRSAPLSGSATILGSFARFTESDVVGGFLGKNCYAPNALTGECKCPKDSFAVTIQSKFQGNKGSINPVASVYPVQVSLCVPSGL